MGYSVYLQKIETGEPAFAPYSEVVSILKRYGSVNHVDSRIEFTPNGEGLCEVGFVGGSEAEGIDSVGFERPVSGGRLAELIFELLGVEGMCYFEQDATFVLARADVEPDLPEGLLDQCEPRQVTIVASSQDIPL